MKDDKHIFSRYGRKQILGLALLAIAKKGIILLFLTLPGSIWGQAFEQAKSLIAKQQYEKAYYTMTSAVKARPRDADNYLWLARSAMQTYRYQEAVNAYQKFITLKRIKQEDHPMFRELAKAETALAYLNRTEEVIFTDSIIVGKNDFVAQIPLGKEAGKVTTVGQFFNQSNKENLGLCLTQKGDRMITAADSPDKTLKLYSATQLIEGWGDIAPLSENLSSTGNENYPFLLTDGITLYFASDGFDGLGGYDIFATRFNTETKSWLSPENMGMPFNSPYNDYLLAIDEFNNVGWLVTDRFQSAEQVIIYQFIPNQTKKILRDRSETELRSRAMITSIKESWPAGYTPEKKTTNPSSASIEEAESENSFDFPLDDKRLYHELSDFQSPEAKALFTTWRENKRKVKSLDIKLEKKRVEYSQASVETQKTLVKEILSLEQEYNQLSGSLPGQEAKIRNVELLHLRNNRK